MDILVTGGAGQLGVELQRRRWPGDAIIHAPARTALDLADPASIERAVASRPWAAVINAGAYTAVDKAESDVAAAWAVNALGPAALAAATAKIDCPIIHISTDYVFNGAKAGWYVEADAVAPINVYGASKEGGEQAVRSANARHVILRTSWVFSAQGVNFLRTMLRIGAERPQLRIVGDQMGCPTAAKDLASAIATITLSMIRDRDAPAGTFHLTNAGATSWHGFAAEIFRNSSAMAGPAPALEPVAADQYPTAARRPTNSRLDTGLLARAYGIAMRPWEEAVSDVVTTILRQTPTAATGA